jgi:spore germination protein
MIIHTVQPNETITSIAEMYGVSTDRLIIDNQIANPNRLVNGQSLVVLFPKETYQVQDGDTLVDIAVKHGVSVLELLRNNPQLCNRMYIFPGEELVISFSDEKLAKISTDGYAFPFIDMNVLYKTLPYLTYLTIFYYQITSSGDLVDIQDSELINAAKEYRVAPIMLISTLSDTGITDTDLTHRLLSNKDLQEHLINRTIEIMKTKGYYGVNVDMQFIAQEDRPLFLDFINIFSTRVKENGFMSMITITPNTFPEEVGVIYLGPEYSVLGQYTDSTMLLSYIWGHAYSPQPSLPLAELEAIMEYITSQIPPEKINIGVPTIGYIWQLPFIPGSSIANAITHNSAIYLASDLGVDIQRDIASEAPFFTYMTDKNYIVWFRDVRSISAILAVVVKYNLGGIGTWNIMQFSTGMWALINAIFEIKKII